MAAVLHATVDAERVTQAQGARSWGRLASALPAASDALRGAKTPSTTHLILFLLFYEGGTTTCVHPSSSGASPRWMSVSRVYKSKHVGPGSVL